MSSGFVEWWADVIVEEMLVGLVERGWIPPYSEHDHCDRDPVECSVEALRGQYEATVEQRDWLRSYVQEQGSSSSS